MRGGAARFAALGVAGWLTVVAAGCAGGGGSGDVDMAQVPLRCAGEIDVAFVVELDDPRLGLVLDHDGAPRCADGWERVAGLDDVAPLSELAAQRLADGREVRALSLSSSSARVVRSLVLHDPTPDPGGIGSDPTPDPGGLRDDPTPDPGGLLDDPTPDPGGLLDDPTPDPGGWLSGPAPDPGGLRRDPTPDPGGALDDPTPDPGASMDDP